MNVGLKDEDFISFSAAQMRVIPFSGHNLRENSKNQL